MNSDERNVETADVVVIGAGVAGLAAARELARAGRRPLVLEEGAHAGGRIETIETDYGHLENGASSTPTTTPASARS